MNLFTSLFLSILLATITHVTGMEQTLNLDELIRTCPNQIISYLDGESLSALTRVCHLFQAICDQVPTKYLSILFSDVAKNKNTQLINRFIAQPDSWMFKAEIGNEFTDKIIIGKDIIEMSLCSFGKGLQDFFGTHAFLLRFTQDNKVVRYILPRMDSCQPNRCMIYFNVNECNDAVNIALKDRLSPSAQKIISNCSYFNLTNQQGYGGYIGVSSDGEYIMHKYFSLTNTSHSTESMLKQFGLITIFLIAAQKNQTSIIYPILSNSEILDSWSPDILNIAQYDLDNGNEIKDVVAAVLFEREVKTLNISAL